MEQAVSHNDDAYESPGIRALRLSVQQLKAKGRYAEDLF